MDQILLEAISKYMKDKKGSGNSQLEITKGRLSLTNLTVFHCERTGYGWELSY